MKRSPPPNKHYSNVRQIFGDLGEGESISLLGKSDDEIDGMIGRDLQPADVQSKEIETEADPIGTATQSEESPELSDDEDDEYHAHVPPFFARLSARMRKKRRELVLTYIGEDYKNHWNSFCFNLAGF